ncbi:MAG: hypothetical protein PHW87_07800 [Methanothrix sp.]|nr:hypothetical protein [Methanothrix sp.]
MAGFLFCDPTTYGSSAGLPQCRGCCSGSGCVRWPPPVGDRACGSFVRAGWLV